MNPLPSVIRVLCLPCEEAAFLASEALDRDLTTSEALATRLHRVVCSGCRHYRDQLLILRGALRRLDDGDGPIGGPTLPPEAREKIRRALRDD